LRLWGTLPTCRSIPARWQRAPQQLAWTAFRTMPLLNREQDLSRVRVPARWRPVGVPLLRRPQLRPRSGFSSVLTPSRGIFRLTSWVSPSPVSGPNYPASPGGVADMTTETTMDVPLWEKLGDGLSAFSEGVSKFLTRLFGSSNERTIRALGYLRA